MIVEKNGKLSAGCWDAGDTTENGKLGYFRQSRGGYRCRLCIGVVTDRGNGIDVKGLWWNSEYRTISVFQDCVRVFAKDGDNCLIFEYSGENDEKEPRMMINDIAKMTLLKMYSETIKFSNDEVDCMETIEEHLRELDRFRLGVPTEIFDKYVNYLKELVYNLPEIECSDILLEGNVIPDEESLEVFIYRHFERTLSAKYSFQEFAKKEFATIIHC